jgi:LGFP repeat
VTDLDRVVFAAENVPLGIFHHVHGRITDRAAAYRSIHQKIAEQPIFGQMTDGVQAIPGTDYWMATCSNGVIYWSRKLGALGLWGDILTKYNALGGFQGFLGFPIVGQSNTPAPRDAGQSATFQNGWIYFLPGSGAFEVHGDIAGKWFALGGPLGLLGFPVTDESNVPFGEGRFNHFENGSIYWRSDIGANEVHGAIRERWSSLGWERSFLRFPISDELTYESVSIVGNPPKRISYFERGRIAWWASGQTEVTPNRLVIVPNQLGPSTVTAHDVVLSLLSDGHWAFKGRITEEGAVGHDYAYWIASTINVNGQVYAVQARGDVAGRLSFGDKSDSWEQAGLDQFIIDQWDELVQRFNNEPNHGFKWGLAVSTNVLNLTFEVVFAALLVGPVIAVAILSFGGRHTQCGSGVYRDDQGGVGAEYTCTTTF